MPIRDRIIWGTGNPFSDPRFSTFEELLRFIRSHGGSPPLGIVGNRVFLNLDNDLPTKPLGYYREYDLVPTPIPGQGDRGTKRFVLGQNGEVYITGNHYRDFRQVINIPL